MIQKNNLQNVTKQPTMNKDLHCVLNITAMIDILY